MCDQIRKQNLNWISRNAKIVLNPKYIYEKNKHVFDIVEKQNLGNCCSCLLLFLLPLFFVNLCRRAAWTLNLWDVKGPYNLLGSERDGAIRGKRGCVGFLARATRAALFPRIRSPASTLAHASARTRTHFADYLIAANVSTKAQSKSNSNSNGSSTKQNSKGGGGGAGWLWWGGLCSKAMLTVMHIIIGSSRVPCYFTWKYFSSVHLLLP